MKTDTKKIYDIFSKARRHPMVEFRFIYDGFAFHVLYHSTRQWYEGVILYSPKWGHTHHFYGDTPKSFFDSMESLIKDSRDVFTNGGHYPDNYYDNYNYDQY